MSDTGKFPLAASPTLGGETTIPTIYPDDTGTLLAWELIKGLLCSLPPVHTLTPSNTCVAARPGRIL